MVFGVVVFSLIVSSTFPNDLLTNTAQHTEMDTVDRSGTEDSILEITTPVGVASILLDCHRP